MKPFYLSFLSIILLLSLGFISCSSDSDEGTIRPITEDRIVEALISMNDEVLKTEINGYFSQYPTNASTTDEEYEKMFNSLIANFNSLKGIEVSFSCFGCIYTLPAKSEIGLMIDSPTGKVVRVLDFSISPETSKFLFLNTHK